MPAPTDDDTIRNLVQSAEARLERAETYVSKTRPELTCEDAQQTAELALKALIKANGGVYKRTHEIEHLLEALEDLGETVLPAVEAARELTDYGGAERYEFITGAAEAPAIESIADAVRAARETLTWCRSRIRALKPGLSLDTRR
ncbi:MAG: HEPN domain-containing protein [Acidobacteria bacterium]|nr:HEPN domain-containing protein [Acidobacteriota bacterium]